MKVKLCDLPEAEHLSHGNLACPGCGAMMALRWTLKILGSRTMIVNSTGCLAVVTQMGVPRVPHIHVLFENGPAFASGVDAALDALGKRADTHLLCVAGDGASADIGLASLSGAVERNTRMIYLAYDNESYMNTGGQRSGTTPFGAHTTTTPLGLESRGEERPAHLRKDLPAIMLAHKCPYVASASIGYPMDFMAKIEQARQVDGPSFVYVHAPCPTGWHYDPSPTAEIARLAVRTGFVKLFEAIDGNKRVTKKVRPLPPEDYLSMQRRFAHLAESEEAMAELRQWLADRLADED